MQQGVQGLEKDKQREANESLPLRLKISLYVMIIGALIGFITLRLTNNYGERGFLPVLMYSYFEVYVDIKASHLSDRTYLNARGESIQANSLLELIRLVVSEEINFKPSPQCQSNPYQKECTPPLIQISLGQVLSISSLLLLLSILLLAWPQRGLASLALGLCLALPGSFFLVGSATPMQAHGFLDEQSYLRGEFKLVQEPKPRPIFRYRAGCENASPVRLGCYWLIDKVPLRESLIVLAIVSFLLGFSLWKARATAPVGSQGQFEVLS